MDFNLRTGQTLDENDQYQQYFIRELIVMLGVFTKDAMSLAGLYCLHSGRNSVTKKDSELALKTRAYHGDMFWNRADIQQRIGEMREFLNEDCEEESCEEESCEELCDVDEGETEQEGHPFIKSECTCEVCTTLNGIEEKWNSWYPTEAVKISLKNSINNTFKDNEALQEDDEF